MALQFLIDIITMAQIQAFQSDKVLTRTLFNNFGTLLVFTFVSQDKQKSVELRNNLETTIPIFGDHQNVKYFFIAQESSPQTFKKFDVSEAPTVIFTQTDKKILRRLQTDDVGVIFDALGEEIVAFRERFEKDKSIWHPKIRSILNESQVVLFIKGTADAPKCGFTETIITLFNNQGIAFTYYDILTDQYMRYWLRHYSGWPTYPQVHANGHLIGGLDVCKELAAKGELTAKVPRNSRAKGPQKLKELLGQYKVLVLTDHFSYADKETASFLDKVYALHPDQQIKVYNIALEQQLRQILKQNVNKELPLLFVEGKEVTI